MRRTISALSIATTLGMAAVSHAGGVLYSMHPNFFPEDLRFDCIAQNFNSTAQALTVDALDITGAVVATTGTVAVPTGGVGGISTTGSVTPAVTCRYTVSGSIKKWRAISIITETATNTLRTIVEAK